VVVRTVGVGPYGPGFRIHPIELRVGVREW